MLKPAAALVACLPLIAGCAYFPTPPDPIRIVDSPVDLRACLRLGAVGTAPTANNVYPASTMLLTAVVPAPPGTAATAPVPTDPRAPFVVNLDTMRDNALRLGATTLFLRKLGRRDNSYVEGIAYRCRHSEGISPPRVLL